ncbi:MAG TPA: heme-binding protein [Methylomirabilota bacterium]|nr:heme-binding protein [Methylomirabilota bacterium]
MLATRRFAVTLAVIALLAAPMLASAQLVDKKALTLEAAKRVAAAAEAEAKKINVAEVIAIVDEGGHLLYLQRMDEAQTGSVRIAIEKARSAAAFKRPTKVWSDGLAAGRQAVLGVHGAVPLEGGIPLMAGGKIIGAIGVSGGTSPQDEQVAKAGADTLPK